eukprot:TRINITY_DN3414_c0_g1_i1.p1 TRINITY_DN3414_c0_g1~~TRINITY_DN3414_c0_g1_i1.p1  ORF type:complete len:328 (+),score=74.46 TRINITY_DN3414_c0_g1_i1:60-986(+)
MGALGSVLGGDKDFVPAFFLDFENATPKGEEETIFNQVQEVISKHEEILDLMSRYKGCTELIQKAISQPTEENKDRCWRALLPTAETLKDFYLHSEKLAEVFPLLVNHLCGPEDAVESFGQRQALTKQLASIVDFAMAYDDYKMVNPAISNDFSYYRRSMSGMKLQGGVTKFPISEELANKMSLFFAFPTPMLNVITTSVAQNKKTSPMKLVIGMSLLANVCWNLVEFKRFDNTETLMFCLRAAVGFTITVDSIFEPGIFHPKVKKTPINPKKCVTVLQNFTDAPVSNLMSALKYNCKEAATNRLFMD